MIHEFDRTKLKQFETYNRAQSGNTCAYPPAIAGNGKSSYVQVMLDHKTGGFDGISQPYLFTRGYLANKQLLLQILSSGLQDTRHARAFGT